MSGLAFEEPGQTKPRIALPTVGEPVRRVNADSVNTGLPLAFNFSVVRVGMEWLRAETTARRMLPQDGRVHG